MSKKFTIEATDIKHRTNILYLDEEDLSLNDLMILVVDFRKKNQKYEFFIVGYLESMELFIVDNNTLFNRQWVKPPRNIDVAWQVDVVNEEEIEKVDEPNDTGYTVGKIEDLKIPPKVDSEEGITIESKKTITNSIKYETKDSGNRTEYETGFVRDMNDSKPRFDLITPLDVPFKQQILTRWADLMTRGANKYGERNWEKSSTNEELQTFKASAFRHFMQWMVNDQDEDHAVAVMFNIQGAERIKSKVEK